MAPAVFLPPQPLGLGRNTPGQKPSKRGQLIGQPGRGPGQDRPGGAGCWEVEGELQAGLGQPPTGSCRALGVNESNLFIFQRGN